MEIAKLAANMRTTLWLEYRQQVNEPLVSPRIHSLTFAVKDRLQLDLLRANGIISLQKRGGISTGPLEATEFLFFKDDILGHTEVQTPDDHTPFTFISLWNT